MGKIKVYIIWELAVFLCCMQVWRLHLFSLYIINYIMFIYVLQSDLVRLPRPPSNNPPAGCWVAGSKVSQATAPSWN